MAETKKNKRSSVKKKKENDRRGSKKGQFGTPPHIPTDEQRETVKLLVSFGNRHEDIALLLKISHDTLERHYKEELKIGAAEINSRIAKVTAMCAMDIDHKDGQRAREYWLSRRAGWKETLHHELTGPDGKPVSVAIIDDV